MRGRNIPPKVGESRKFSVNRPGQVEGIYQPLYDFQTYLAAGQTSLTFFAVPQGQGGKTLADTNMESAGALPAPKKMLVTSIEVAFFPGGNPSTYGAAAAIAGHFNDLWTVFKSGYLKFFVGSKDYLIDAPIGKFSNSFRVGGVAAIADSTTLGAGQQSMVQLGAFVGPQYEITPIELVANQNFNVTLNWPALVPTISTVAGRIGVILNGWQYRLSQ